MKIRLDWPEPEYICRTLCESDCIRDCRTFERKSRISEGVEGYAGLWTERHGLSIDFEIYKDPTSQYEVYSAIVINEYNHINILLRFPIYGRPDIDISHLVDKHSLGLRKRSFSEGVGTALHLVGDMVFNHKRDVYKIIQRIRDFIDELLIQESKGNL